MRTICLADFQHFLGMPDLGKAATATLANTNFAFDTSGAMGEQECVLKVLQDLQTDQVENKVGKWESGWEDIFQDYRRTGLPTSLIPKHLFKHRIFRFHQRYIKALTRNFEANYYRVVSQALFHHYLSEVPSVIDFGCGTGLNLLTLHEMFPEKRLVGCDWAEASQKILDAISERVQKVILGVKFNMLEPTVNVPFTCDSAFAVITVHAMEQLGKDWGPFVDYLLAKKPRICVHLEPLFELYNQNNLLDYLAVLYHRKRGYLEGFLPHIRKLEQEGKVEVIDTRRLYFGSFYHEAYSVMVWRPK